MKTVWTDDLKDTAAKADFEQGLKNSIYLKKLLSILEARERDLTSQLISPPSGEAWAYKQAHLQGRLFDLKDIQQLLTFDHKGN